MAKNLTFYRGATQTFTANIKPTALEPGDTVYFTVKQNYDNDMTDASALIRKDVTSAVQENVISFKLTPQDTNVEPGKYVYDIILEKPETEDRIPLLSGKIKITPAVTLRGIE